MSQQRTVLKYVGWQILDGVRQSDGSQTITSAKGLISNTYNSESPTLVGETCRNDDLTFVIGGNVLCTWIGHSSRLVGEIKIVVHAVDHDIVGVGSDAHKQQHECTK
ncbi:hypothetical protein [uncultured Prevotella sp.]|uniref:hypothetical protein n=1 Tax=uncultured Prevotella sp. TaxID=159272 RepID=UPI00258F442F|nr:hypothetical protein [uncultured Prevotella sp.]